MTREEFDRLVEKYNSGDCTLEELTLLEEWASLHFKQYSENTVFDTEEESTAVEDRMWKGIRSELVLKNREGFMARGRRAVSRFSVAASVFIMLGALFLLLEKPFRHKELRPGKVVLSGIETKNTTGSRQRVVLPDSSIVTLEAGSVILADEDYGRQNRTVYLSGGAFFEVKSNWEAPFLVYSGGLVTEVLGTSFRINPEEDGKTIEVTVVSGKVSIYTDNSEKSRKRNGVIAVPNQKVVYNTQLKTIRQDLVDIPEMIVPPLQKSTFIFDETPVENLLALMRKVYGVEIVLSSPLLNTCVFTGDLNDLELYEQLDHVTEVINARYEIRGTTIFVTGDGCKKELIENRLPIP